MYLLKMAVLAVYFVVGSEQGWADSKKCEPALGAPEIQSTKIVEGKLEQFGLPGLEDSVLLASIERTQLLSPILHLSRLKVGRQVMSKMEPQHFGLKGKNATSEKMQLAINSQVYILNPTLSVRNGRLELVVKLVSHSYSVRGKVWQNEYFGLVYGLKGREAGKLISSRTLAHTAIEEKSDFGIAEMRLSPEHPGSVEATWRNGYDQELKSVIPLVEPPAPL